MYTLLSGEIIFVKTQKKNTVKIYTPFTFVKLLHTHLWSIKVPYQNQCLDKFCHRTISDTWLSVTTWGVSMAWRFKTRFSTVSIIR